MVQLIRHIYRGILVPQEENVNLVVIPGPPVSIHCCWQTVVLLFRSGCHLSAVSSGRLLLRCSVSVSHGIYLRTAFLFCSAEVKS